MRKEEPKDQQDMEVDRKHNFKEQNKILKKHVKELTDQLDGMKELQKESDKNLDMLRNLYKLGLINKDGTPKKQDVEIDQ